MVRYLFLFLMAFTITYSVPSDALAGKKRDSKRDKMLKRADVTPRSLSKDDAMKNAMKNEKIKETLKNIQNPQKMMESALTPAPTCHYERIGTRKCTEGENPNDILEDMRKKVPK